MIILPSTEPPQPKSGPTKEDEHWCMHDGCRQWGGWGYETRFGTHWYCYEHRDEGEKVLR